MKQITQQLQQLAARQFRSVLPDSPAAHGHFKAMMTAEIEGEAKPLLFVGAAHRNYDDGYCIAVLNPEQALIDEIPPGCAYTLPILREQVQHRCDAAVLVSFSPSNLREGLDGAVTGAYVARTPTQARFCVV